MAISLYDLSVGSYLQTLGAVAGFLDRGIAHCEENNIDPNDVVETRLFADMLPFRFQIQSVVHHSLGAIEGAKKGVFSPATDMLPHDYRALQKLVADARGDLHTLSEGEINGLEGKDVDFQFRDFKIPYVAENFFMSFSLPNFYFHAATAYDILRMKGAPLGKRDFMGEARAKI